MRRMIMITVVSVLWGGFTTTAAQLPPDIMADAYLLQAEQAVRDGDLSRAQAVMQNLLLLQAEHDLVLPDEFHFRYAKAATAAGLPELVPEAVVKYLAMAGRDGEHYTEALELMNMVQAESLRDGVAGAAAQLPPDIMADAYLLQAEQAIREEDYAGARTAMEKILSLQAEHDLTLPEEFHFKYAQVAALENLPEQALEAVMKYLAAAGREGEHYVEALELMNMVQAAASCKGWNTDGYFETATLEQITACLETGAVDLDALNALGFTPLQEAAVGADNPAAIEALLAAGADVNARRNDVFQSRVAAALAGVDVNAQRNGGWTPLHGAAAFNENPAVIEALLDAGADVNARRNGVMVAAPAGVDVSARRNGGWTPLHGAAAFNENPAVIEALRAAGAYLEAQDDSGRTPLHRAANNENPAVIEALRAAVQAPVRCTRWNTDGYFETATLEQITACLETGTIDLDALNASGFTPLQEAAVGADNPAVIEALLDAGADRTIALYIAAQNNVNPAVVQVLIDAGADPTQKMQAAQNCKQWDEEKFFREAAVEDVIACLDAGADPMDRARYDKTPLHLAAKVAENPEVVKVLIAAGADVNARAKDGKWGSSHTFQITPLHWAAGHNENPEVAKVLIAAGADVNARTGSDLTPLHWATGSENPEVVKVLIAAGANLNARSQGEWTPLHWAADHSENPEVVKVLIAAGANLMARQWQDKTPLQVSRRGNREVLRNAWAGLTVERQKEMQRAAGPREENESGPDLFGLVVGVAGGTAIAAAGGGTEEALAAAADFAESVIGGQQPVGNSGGGFDPGVSAPGGLSTSGNPGTTAGLGSCQLPNYPNLGDTENLGLSWCPASVDFQVRAFALQAAGIQCSVSAVPDPPQEMVSRARSQIREVCSRLAALGTRLGGPNGGASCRCPAGFGP